MGEPDWFLARRHHRRFGGGHPVVAASVGQRDLRNSARRVDGLAGIQSVQSHTNPEAIPTGRRVGWIIAKFLKLKVNIKRFLGVCLCLSIY